MMKLIQLHNFPAGKTLPLLLFIVLAAIPCTAEEKKSEIPATTADHKEFKALKKDFANGREVTRACLTCHTEAAEQIHNSIHWTWKWGEDLGKRNALNNF